MKRHVSSVGVASADGRQVAFDRGEAIWVIGVDGSDAKRIVARGRSVTWGGGNVPLAARV
jgi:hypothetical protein